MLSGSIQLIYWLLQLKVVFVHLEVCVTSRRPEITYYHGVAELHMMYYIINN